MANSTVGQLLSLGGSASPDALHTSELLACGPGGSRLMTADTGASGVPGSKLSGRTYRSGAAAVRRITIMTQPPRPRVIAELVTSTVNGATFECDFVPPGNYLVLDTMLDNSRQALVYDWIVRS